MNAINNDFQQVLSQICHTFAQFNYFHYE